MPVISARRRLTLPGPAVPVDVQAVDSENLRSRVEGVETTHARIGEHSTAWLRPLTYRSAVEQNGILEQDGEAAQPISPHPERGREH